MAELQYEGIAAPGPLTCQGTGGTRCLILCTRLVCQCCVYNASPRTNQVVGRFSRLCASFFFGPHLLNAVADPTALCNLQNLRARTMNPINRGGRFLSPGSTQVSTDMSVPPETGDPCTVGMCR